MSTRTTFSDAKDRAIESLKNAQQEILKMSNPETSGYDEYTDEFIDEVLEAQKTIRALLQKLE